MSVWSETWSELWSSAWAPPPPTPPPAAPPPTIDLVIVDPVAQSVVAVAATSPLSGYLRAEWTEWLWQPDRLDITLSTVAALETLHIDVGMLIVVGDRDLAFVVDTIDGTIRRDGESEIRVTASDPLSSDADVGWRVIVPDAGSSHDAQVGVSAETAMKHYVAEHFGDTAEETVRRLPVPVSIATDLGRGRTGTWRGRYQQHTDYLRLIGGRARLGWRTTWDFVNRQLVFDVIQGRSRPQRLSLAYGTIAEERFLRTIRGTPSFAYVAGQGTGAARTIVTRFEGLVEPSGWARREVFVDARDTNDTATLRQRGDEAIAESAEPDPLEVEMQDSPQFAFPDDWDVGDTLTYEPTWGAARRVRIVGVTTTVEESLVPSRRAHLDRPWPQLGDVRARSGGTDFE